VESSSIRLPNTMTKSTLGILDLLALRGFDPNKPAKLVRHQDKRYDVLQLLRDRWLETYQCYQSRPVFDGLDFIVSFVGAGGTRARFVGVYRVLDRRPGIEAPLPPNFPLREFQQSRYYYTLERQPGFEDFEGRLIIEWGLGALAWHQRLSNKPVFELLSEPSLLTPFKDYLEFTLTYSELQYLYLNPEANKEWRARLSAVAGVYLILARTTGAQYVGSAYGLEDIWGRWSDYARNGHGENRGLRMLIEKNSSYPAEFLYSILQILPKTLAKREVLNWEGRYMKKLGTRLSLN